MKANYNTARTAREMYLHRKTVLYRINRIQEVSGLDFDDHKQMFNAELGIIIIKFLRTQGIDYEKDSVGRF